MNKWNNKFRYKVASCWLFILCISYTGDGGQLGCSFLWSVEGVGVGRATAKKVIGQMINEVADRCDVVMFSLLPKGREDYPEQI